VEPDRVEVRLQEHDTEAAKMSGRLLEQEQKSLWEKDSGRSQARERKTQLKKTLEVAEMRPSLATEEMKSGPRPCHEEKSM
jgi:hypothetical protein